MANESQGAAKNLDELWERVEAEAKRLNAEESANEVEVKPIPAEVKLEEPKKANEVIAEDETKEPETVKKTPTKEIVESLGSDVEIGLPEHDVNYLRNLKVTLNGIDNRLRTIKERQKSGDAVEAGGARELAREARELQGQKDEIKRQILNLEGQKNQEKELAKLEDIQQELIKEAPGTVEEKLLRIEKIDNVVELLQLMPSESRAKEVLGAIKMTDFVVKGKAVETKKYQKYGEYSLEEAEVLEGEFIESESAKSLLESLRAEIKQELIEKLRDETSIEKMAEESIESCELGKNLKTEIEKQRQVPEPPKMGFVSRIYLGLFEGDKLKLQKERERAYQKSQDNLKKLTRGQKTWLKAERELAKAAVDSKIETILYLSKLEAAEQLGDKDLKKVLSISAEVYAKRIAANKMVGGLAKGMGISGGLPETENWKDLANEPKAVERMTMDLKESFVASFSEGLGKKFVDEHLGEEINQLSEIKTKELLAKEGLAKALLMPGTEGTTYQLLLELNQLREGIKHAEAAVESKIKRQETAKKIEAIGQGIKESIKKEFGYTLMKVDPDFEIKFDTALSKIILNGQGNLANYLSSTAEAHLAGKTAVNRSHSALVSLRRRLNEKLHKIIPESDRIATKITALEDREAVLGARNKEIKEAISYIVSEKAGAWERVMGEATQKDRVAFKNEIILEIAELVTSSPAEKSKLEAEIKANGATDRIIEQLVRSGERKLLMNGREASRLKTEIKELNEDIRLLEHRVKKATDKVAKDEALEQLALLMEERSRFEVNLKMEKDHQDAVVENLLREVARLRDASEKHLAKKLAESFKKAA